jgi:hypothetical protein
MIPRAPTSNPRQRARHEPLYDIHPRTGVSIEVFYADRTLETFGGCDSGWFWWPRRRGCSPEGQAIGPFATSYAAYRHAMTPAPTTLDVHERLANRTSPSMCRTWDMDELAYDGTGQESLGFIGTC